MHSSWALDLANISAVYPWQGLEVPLVIITYVIWIGWHVVQIRQENRDYEDDINEYGDNDSIATALDAHPL